MSKIKVILPMGEIPVTGKQVSFKAPCACEEITSIIIGSDEFALVDACKNAVNEIPEVFAEGALISVVIDVEGKMAYIQNAANNRYGSPIKQNIVNGIAILEVNKKYRVYADVRHEVDADYFDCQIRFATIIDGINIDGIILPTIESTDIYRQYFDIEILAFNRDTACTIETVIYEVDGVRLNYSYNISVASVPTPNVLRIIGANEIYSGGSGGFSSSSSATGGYYTPSLSDNGDGSYTFSFTPSSSDMPNVDHVTVTLPAGADGVGIKSITKTSTSGLVDTYTITLTNNTTTTFTVTNGEDGKDGNGGGDDYIGTLDEVSSVEEMTDPEKRYVLDGYIYESRAIVTEGGTTSPNLFAPSAESLNKRMSGTNGSVSSRDGCFITDFIAVPNDFATATSFIVRLSRESICTGNSKVVFFSGTTRVGANILKTDTNTTAANGETVTDVKTKGDSTSVLPSDWSTVTHLRMEYQISTSAIALGDIENLKVTFDAYNVTTEGETIVEWVNTGEVYEPINRDELILQNAADILDLQEDVKTLQNAVAGGEIVSPTVVQSDTVWNAIGDSITAGLYVGADKCWVAHVMAINGYSTSSKNLGVSGIGFARADPTNNKTIRTVVDANSFANVNLVTVAVGINDWQEGCDIASVKSEMEYCFGKILTDNPCCKIFFVTPLNKKRGTQETNWALGYEVNGLTLDQFVEQQVSVCESAGIEVIDMTHNSVINKYNLPSMFSDSTHPTVDCHKALGKELARKIKFA